MIKALLLIFCPLATWERIKDARRGTAFILVCYLVPLLAVAACAEGFGLITWGKPRGVVPKLKPFEPGETVLFEAIQLLLFLGVAFLLARLVKALGDTFHGRHTFLQTFTAVAYALGPLCLLQAFNAFPAISPWLTWAIGVLLAMSALYYGLPCILEPDPPTAFGLYIMSAFMLVLVTGVLRFVTSWYLRGKFADLEAWLIDAGRRLPF